MVLVELTRGEMVIISKALEEMALRNMAIAARRRKVVNRDSKVKWYPQNLLPIDLAAINAVEEYAAKVLAIKEGKFDRTLESIKAKR